MQSDDPSMCGIISDQPHAHDLIVVTKRDNSAYIQAQQMSKTYEEHKRWRKELYERIIQHENKGWEMDICWKVSPFLCIYILNGAWQSCIIFSGPASLGSTLEGMSTIPPAGYFKQSGDFQGHTSLWSSECGCGNITKIGMSEYVHLQVWFGFAICPPQPIGGEAWLRDFDNTCWNWGCSMVTEMLCRNASCMLSNRIGA
jgi:hypothetical protein